MVAELAGAEFAGSDEGRKRGRRGAEVRGAEPCGAQVYRFRKAGREFAGCWTTGAPSEVDLGRPAARILDRDGRESAGGRGPIRVERSPKYVFFEG